MDSPEGVPDTSHYLQSSLREKLLEHGFIGELLQRLWWLGRRDIEVISVSHRRPRAIARVDGQGPQRRRGVAL